MAKPVISRFLKRADRLVWARFLSSPEGRAGLAFLRMACPSNNAVTDADLIRNSVGFDYWQKCISEIEAIGEVPERPERAEDDQPLET